MRKTKDVVVKMTDRLNPEALEAARLALGRYNSRGGWLNDQAEVTISAYLAALTEPDSTLITDELTRVVEALHGYDCPDDPDPGEACTCDGDTYYRMAEVALEAAALPAPRTITTIAELDALPVGTVIQDFNDDIMQIIELDNDDTSTGERGGVREFGFEEGRFEFLSWVKLPALVLWVPTEGGGE